MAYQKKSILFRLKYYCGTEYFRKQEMQSYTFLKSCHMQKLDALGKLIFCIWGEGKTGFLKFPSRCAPWELLHSGLIIIIINCLLLLVAQ